MNKTIILVIQYSAIVILLFEFIYVSCRKPSEMQKDCIVVIISTMLMFAGYNIELYSTNLETALSGTVVAYIGKPFVMLSSFMFVCEFYHKKIDKRLFVALCCFCSVFAFLVATNKSHHLYYATTEFDISLPYSPLIVTRGPLYYLYVVTSVVFFLACLIVSITGRKKIKDKHTLKMCVYIYLMVFFGIGGYAVYLTQITNGYDATMIGVFVGVICLLVLFFQYNIFDVADYGKDIALEESNIGTIVFDNTDEIAYRNKIVEYYFGLGVTKYYLLGLPEGETVFEAKGKRLAIKVKRLGVDGVYIGKNIEITDNTKQDNS